jgi:hypothetical protein
MSPHENWKGETEVSTRGNKTITSRQPDRNKPLSKRTNLSPMNARWQPKSRETQDNWHKPHAPDVPKCIPGKSNGDNPDSRQPLLERHDENSAGQRYS